MFDSLGGPDRVNNFLSTMNINPIGSKNLKQMERRGCVRVEAVSARSTKEAVKESFKTEVR